MEIEGSEILYGSKERYSDSKDFTSLECWKKSRDVKIFFYLKVLYALPKEEKYNLDIQIRKAAVSITANIAEGYGRFHYQEGIQFYRISRGPMYELKDHLISCKDLNYIDEENFQIGIKKIEEAKRVLNGFINYVKNKLKK